MGRNWLALIGTLAVTLVVTAGCSTASPSTSAPPQVPAASDQAADTACSPIDLYSPAGNLLDLTGIWRANDFGYYNLYQWGSCLHWLGQSDVPGRERGQDWTNVFVGSIASDFTISGRWGDVPFDPTIPTGNFGAGSLSLAIEFVGSGAAEFPILRLIEATGGFGGTRIVPEGSLSGPITLDGTFGGNFDHLFDTGCIWIESNGVRYDLLGAGGAGWEIRGEGTLRIEDEQGQIVARAGDPIRVVGIASPGLGFDCVESAILVEELDPTP